MIKNPIISVMVLLIVFTVLSACSNTNNSSRTSEPHLQQSSQQHSTMSNGSIQDFDVQYIRTGYVGGSVNPVIFVIRSEAELEQFFGLYMNRYDLLTRWQSYSDLTMTFMNAAAKYNNNFFTDKFLVVITLEENSGSIRHKVERIENNGNIVINRLVPEIGTSDMAEWNIIIELNNSFKAEEFRAIFVDTN